MQAWTIKQLKEKLIADLALCTTAHEKIMCNAIGGKEIKEKAEEWAATRKLTPIESAIAQDHGYRGK